MSDELIEAARFALEILDADSRILAVEQGSNVTQRAAEKLRTALPMVSMAEVIRTTSEAVRSGPIEARRAVEVERSQVDEFNKSLQGAEERVAKALWDVYRTDPDTGVLLGEAWAPKLAERTRERWRAVARQALQPEQRANELLRLLDKVFANDRERALVEAVERLLDSGLTIPEIEALIHREFAGV